jgi:hypothetical protein
MASIGIVSKLHAQVIFINFLLHFKLLDEDVLCMLIIHERRAAVPISNGG